MCMNGPTTCVRNFNEKRNIDLKSFPENKSEFTQMIMMGKSIDHKFEPPRGETNNEVSEQVRHKQACTITEES